MTTSRPTPSNGFYTHLPRRWRDTVAFELRLRGASGATIGDVLAEAQAHCAESGESPEEAFGPAEEYAAAVPLSDDEQPESAPELTRAALPALVGLAGMMLAFATADAWQTDQPTAVSWGVVLGVVMILAVSVALVRWLHLVAARTWVLAVLVGLAASVFTVVTVALGSPAFELPTPVAALASVALLTAGALWTRRGPEPDTITDPLRGDPTPRATRITAAIHPWLFPALSVLGVVLVLAIGS